MTASPAVGSNATGTFRSFANPNFRLWFAGSLISNIGTWMQRTAQDWLVLTELAHVNGASAVGIVMALQFGPLAVLLPFSGFAADYFDRRRLLLVTQGASGLLALGLGALTLLGVVQLWHVYLFALGLGCVAAFDAPARQTFISEVVGEADLANAVALNSASFNGARMIGPAVAGLLIAAVGTGWVFLINGASYLAVIASVSLLRAADLHPRVRAVRSRGSFVEGFRYVWGRPDLTAVLVMLFIIGAFGLNFPIFISTMSVHAFGAGSGEYGVLSSTMAIGSVTGALLAARRAVPTIPLLLGAALLFAAGCALAAVMPTPWLFGVTLVIVGVAAQTFTTSTNSLVQLSTDSAMRGRVVALLLAIAMGGTPLGAPIVGWVADVAGPRWALGLGAASGLVAALVGVRYLVRHTGWRLRGALKTSA
ncbi:MFS transporter [Azospirillum sp. B4]|uniref:MFS transporter n=1 Tax=Azospirillum sp. B4 TaxID=95605 RepID=UPI000349BC37|nr:MFS transporter [Azospirillum sp. B4]